ncbi:MAG: FAD-binding protein, partial [Actinomycetota bacterium]|nr:FAD-binding protein [Actinomycetota bacterium]
MPGESTYRPGALLYNPRFANQPKPKAIAYCAHRSDVINCVRFAAEGGAALRIRNGGHSYGGWSSGPGLVANLAAMNAVQVDHSAMTATIGAGALLADVYSQLDAKGVSIGAGSCATVGLTGLALGGGVGLLTRLYGLTCDQLVSAVVITADTQTRTVSADRNPDLFWALRGGGGSFAAVTSLTFKVRPAPRVQEVFLQWPGSDAAQVLSAWQDWSGSTPRELWSTCKILAR